MRRRFRFECLKTSVFGGERVWNIRTGSAVALYVLEKKINARRDFVLFASLPSRTFP